MSNSTFDRRSNIFGLTTSSSSTGEIAFATDETTEAGKLIDKLKNIADNQLLKLNASVDWLGLAANAGQNSSGKSFVKYESQLPDPIDSGNIFKDWVAPTLPVLPAFPTLPADLKIDLNGFKADVAALVDKLQTSWMAKFLPPTTDISKYDSLMKDILGGTSDSVVTAKLDVILTNMQNDLNSVKADALTDVKAQIITLNASLLQSINGIQPMIDAAIATAQDNTSNIVFARGRDQVAREAARQEAQVISDWAANGWSMPSGVLAAHQSAARQNTLDAASKIAAEEAVRTQTMNVEFAKMAIDAWQRTADFQLRANIENMKAALEARLRYSAMQIEADRTVAEQSIKNLGLRLDFSRFGADFALRYRTEAINGMNGLIQAYAALNRGEMEYYAAIAQAQRTNLDALIGYYRLSLSEAEMGLKVSTENVATKLKWATIAGQFIAQCVGHHVQAAAATGNMYAQVAGMSLAGLNGVASTSVSS